MTSSYFHRIKFIMVTAAIGIGILLFTGPFMVNSQIWKTWKTLFASEQCFEIEEANATEQVETTIIDLSQLVDSVKPPAMNLEPMDDVQDMPEAEQVADADTPDTIALDDPSTIATSKGTGPRFTLTNLTEDVIIAMIENQTAVVQIDTKDGSFGIDHRDELVSFQEINAGQWMIARDNLPNALTAGWKKRLIQEGIIAKPDVSLVSTPRLDQQIQAAAAESGSQSVTGCIVNGTEFRLDCPSN